MIGVTMKQAPQDWQIIQQVNGFGTMEAAGLYEAPENMRGKKIKIYLRAVREDSARDVTGWQQAECGENSCWKISMQVPAGGLYRLESCLLNEGSTNYAWGIRGDMRHHLGVGDLYVIAGQSNSAGYAKDPAYDPPEMGVHLLRNSMRWDLATHPMNEATDTVHPENLEPENPGACPYLSFAKLLKRELGYPVGLLQASKGGSPLSAWNPAEKGVLYRSMMDTIASQGGRIRGVLWYQGCSDCSADETADSYFARFRSMVLQFRKDMGENVPWLTVQLNRRAEYNGQDFDRRWGAVREAQRQAARLIPGVSVIPTTDCCMSDTIHISALSHIRIGERLAEAALRDIYGRPCGSGAPDLEEAVLTEQDMIELRFSHIRMEFFSFGPVNAAQKGFTVWDEEGEIPVASVRCAGTVLKLSLVRPAKAGCTVSAGWQMNPPVLLPADSGTHTPILSFYKIPVKAYRY